MKKSQLLNWLQEEYRRWEVLLDRIGLARLDEPGVNGEWSMKDIATHLTGWNRWLVIRLQAAQRGQPEPPPPWPAELESEDDINAWISESGRGRSVDEVLDDMRQVHQQLVAVIEALDEPRIDHIEPAFYLVWVGDQRYVASEFFNHFHDDHEQDVRTWMRRVE